MFSLLENKVAYGFEDPLIAEVPDSLAELDIFEDIDTVAVALVDQAVGLSAVAMKLGHYLEAVRLCMDPDFDPMKGMVIVLEMY
jgi:hypothetical protein